MSDDAIRGVNAIGGGIVPRSVIGSVTVPLVEGDEVQIGTDMFNIGTVNALTGEATGFHTYFTIALVNRSTA
jgi:hypothetical protein